MFKRLKLTITAVAGLAALALGGAAIAGATGSPPAKVPTTVKAPEVTGGPDRDTIQSGDQTTPDPVTAKAAQTSDAAAESPDPGESTASETAAPSDGPSGHADAPGNANANVEQQGQN